MARLPTRFYTRNAVETKNGTKNTRFEDIDV